jgi:hypothetical protein
MDVFIAILLILIVALLYRINGTLKAIEAELPDASTPDDDE